MTNFLAIMSLQNAVNANQSYIKRRRIIFLAFCWTLCTFQAISQSSSNDITFWDKVQYGGGLSLNFGNNFTNLSVAPSAIYHFNDYFAAGPGLIYSYMKSRDFFESHLYGASALGLFTPFPELQLSAEIEQLRVNNRIFQQAGTLKDNFWNTALFLGVGYRSQNVVFGVRYNILYNSNDFVYTDAWMPFVRVFF